ncbi:hypothetical protein DRE_00452 [Drechslerella stenobrocha 248]|uniref:Uncharacterized protein n=1 Tax=Drechslerella stenobrocha 248 TaxID=1043628 RepID=W7HVF3_9PEZI|nr:hypothetical protein DRE_00452 [Drechslerella stenobrocha 248]
MGDRDGTSASDIITYIGVPLAVLGVMPVLYTFLVAIITQQHIRRELRRNHVNAVTRTSLMSGTVDVEHPRFSIQPLPRGDLNYWKTSLERSGIRGGSWTIFNWHKIVSGRVNYHLRLRDSMMQPQAEIDFEKLVTFLLDRGAVPDPEGVKLLKTMGLQTPKMTKLLTTAGPVKRSVLVVNNPEDAEGHLSLTLFWADELGARSEGSLPPYWARLQARAVIEKALEGEQSPTRSPSPTPVESNVTSTEIPDTASELGEKQSLEEQVSETEKSPPPPFPAINTPAAWGAGDDKSRLPVRLYLGSTGLEDAKIETMDGLDIYGSFRIEHLRFQYPGSSNNMNLWFAAGAVTALADGHKGLWKYAIPPDLIRFVQKDTMPHGALVWLGLIEEEETPMTIARREAKMRAAQDARHQEFLEGIRHRELEKNMSDAMRQQAQRQRHMAGAQAMLSRQREEARERQEEEFRKKELAVTSHRVAHSVVSSICLDYLKKEKYVPDGVTAQSICEDILYRMMFDEEFANRICKVLDGWKAWGEIGIMNDRHLDELKSDVIGFCYAGILLCLISEKAKTAETWAGSDLADCQKVFRTVYVG